MAKWVLDTFQGVKTWYSGDIIERIKKVVTKNICKKCPEPCMEKMVEPCSDKQVLTIIENEEK